jgi:hypothetical protein
MITMSDAEKMPGPSDLDVALQTILNVTARRAEGDRYAPVLEVITYDLETISDTGTPAELRLEISQMQKCVASTCIVENGH